ncbi:MAG: phytanoyl-CoA dioxygenase family protein [Vicinamibacterales bacterium]
MDPANDTAGAVDFTPLQTRGFVVVSGFLTLDEVQRLRADFEGQPVDAGNKNYSLTPVSGAANEHMQRRVADVLRSVTATTDLRVDLPRGGAYFATGAKRGVFFSWHQDHESFFETQNHYDYLNFYIPIVKPRVDKSNLCVVPFDVLQREFPKTYKYTVRGGATRFGQLGRWQVSAHDDGCTVHFMRGRLDLIAATPHLAAGDLLLMRGDVIHRTQDAETERVALSFRAAAGDTIVRRSRLAAGGINKATMMVNNRLTYERLFLAFDRAGRRELPYRELLAILDTVDLRDQKGWRQFWTYLLIEKLRAGAIPQLAVSVLSLRAVALWSRCVGMYYRTRQRFQRPAATPPARAVP